MAMREALWANHEEIARLVTEDMGKTLDDARGEVLRGIESTEAACGIPHLLKGENLEGVATGVDVELIRQPVGVCAAITPFNFPAMIPLWFLPYAIACGNTFILKPSERDPRPSERIVELIAEVDEIPAGVVNLVHGARDAVSAILDHSDIDAVSFVGQASTARYGRGALSRDRASASRRSAEPRTRSSSCPTPNLETSIPAIMSSSFGAGGQRCLAGSVAVLVGDEAAQNEVLEAFETRGLGSGRGPGDADGVEVCPLVGPEARERIVGALDAADDVGARRSRARPGRRGPRRNADRPLDRRDLRPRVGPCPRGALRSAARRSSALPIWMRRSSS